MAIFAVEMRNPLSSMCVLISSTTRNIIASIISPTLIERGMPACPTILP